MGAVAKEATVDFEQFRDWLEHLKRRHPELGTYLQKLPDSADDEDSITRDEYVKTYQDLFREIHAGDMDFALQAFLSGRVRKPAKAVDYLPALLKYVNGLDKKRKCPTEGKWWAKQEDEYSETCCTQCGGSGVLDVWHPAATRPVELDPLKFIESGSGHWITTMVCRCKNGDRIQRRYETMEYYNEVQDCRADGDTPSRQRTELAAKVEQGEYPRKLTGWSKSIPQPGPQEVGRSDSGEAEEGGGRELVCDHSVAVAEADEVVFDSPGQSELPF
jgi:hypothetical protein